MASSKKSAAGCGTIRKKTVTKNGKDYTYWEARYTIGFDSGTGKQVQKSVSGKTQKEVAQKLKELTAALDAGTYIAPSKVTVGQWLDLWQQDYAAGTVPGIQNYCDGIGNAHGSFSRSSTLLCRYFSEIR